MRVDRDLLIQLILKHKQAFFVLLDYVTLNGGAAAIPQKLYIDQYHQVIVASGDERAIRLLDLESLHRHGIFVHLDNQTETLVIQSFLIEMLRFIDKSRIRELSRSDFEQIRKQFEVSCRKFESDLNITVGMPDYDEALITLFELIDNTLSKVQQNVEALAANADDLGRRYDQLDSRGYTTIDSMKLLEDASRLYERFIKPCLEFLSPDIKLKEQRLTFTQSIERLAAKHENCGYTTTGLRIRYKNTAIRSYYKNIYQIEQRVKRYYNSLASERLKYTAIERAYNQLQDAMSALRHGKLRNTKLSSDAEIFSRSDYLRGLERHASPFDTRINWYETDNLLIVEEWLTAKLLSFQATEPIALTTQPIPVGISVSEERRLHILKLCIERKWPQQQEDIILDAHEWLMEQLENYTLPDLLVAYQYIYSRGIKLIPTMKQSLVHDNQYHLNYLVMRVDENSGENWRAA